MAERPDQLKESESIVHRLETVAAQDAVCRATRVHAASARSRGDRRKMQLSASAARPCRWTVFSM